MHRRNQPHRKEQRRAAANTRLAENAHRSPQAQIECLDSRPGNCTKERSKLERRLQS